MLPRTWILFSLALFTIMWTPEAQAKQVISASLHRREIRSVERLVKRRTAYEKVSRINRRFSVQASNLARNQGAGQGNIARRRVVEHPRATLKPSIGSTTLSDWYQGYWDMQYYVNVMVGTPPQALPVIFDTGSSDFWLGTAGSTGFPVVFEPNSSSTYVDNGVATFVPYNDGTNFSGVAGTDVVTLAGMTVENATIEVGNADSAELGGQNVSGIIGMAWGSLSSTGQPTFVEQLVQNKQLEQDLFSLQLSRGSDSLPPEAAEGNGTISSGGKLTIGGIDNSTYSGSINFYPNLDPSFWAVQADGMALGGALVKGTTGLTAMFDSGTTLIVLPSDVFKAINRALKAKFDRTEGQPVVDCSAKLPEIALRIGGVDYAIAVEELVSWVTPVNSTALALQTGLRAGALACYLPFAEMDCSTVGDSTGCMSIFGDVFLKSWMSVYVYGNSSVGLAASLPPSRFTSVSDVVNFQLQQMGLSRANHGLVANAAKAREQGAILFSNTCILLWAAAFFVLLNSF